MIKKRLYLLILIFAVLILSLMNLIFASPYVRSTPQFSNINIGSGYYSNTNQFNKDFCQEGQDFVLQVMPFGCSPTVITSDLLEEQNTPVYCQLAATKINPVIDVNAIESVTFSGDYPKEVAGVDFQPARAALGTEDTTLTSSVLGNIGYVIVVLKQQPNESAMPDVVRGNLTAKIKYDIKNAFGLEQATFYLPVINSESEWSSKKSSYSFWRGQGSLRAESVGTNGAQISVYNYEKIVDSVSLNVGGKSQKISFPGFDCLAGFEVKLDELKNPGETALLDIDGAIVEVAKSDVFLDNMCSVRNIENHGATKKVEIYCKQDKGSTTSTTSSLFTLEINPKVKLKITGDNSKESDFEAGDRLFSYGEYSAFLGYIGFDYANNQEGTPMIIIVSGKTNIFGTKLTDTTLQTIAKNYNKFVDNSKNTNTGITERDFNNSIKSGLPYINNVQQIISENELYDSSGYNVGITGIASPIDRDIFKEIAGSTTTLGELYGNAKKDYQNVISDYSGIKKYGFEEQNLGDESLYNLINLALVVQQNAEVITLCNEFKTNYPDSKYYNILFSNNGICVNLLALSSYSLNAQTVTINGKTRQINLIGINSPDASSYGVEIEINTKDSSIYRALKYQDTEYFDEKSSIQLIELDESYTTFNIVVPATNQNEVTKTYKIKKGESTVLADGFTKISVVNINLEKRAKVSVVPTVDDQYSYANFSFAVGIEKRAIQLSPERINQSIVNLNEQIKELNEISQKLGTTVEALDKACLATGAVLTISNLVGNIGGKANSRKRIMDEYWGPECQKIVAGGTKGQGYTIEDCYRENADVIEKSVEAGVPVLQNTNDWIQDCYDKEGVTSDSGILGTDINSGKLDDCLKKKISTGTYVNLDFSLIEGSKIRELDSSITNLQSFMKSDYVTKGLLSTEQMRDLQMYSQALSSSDSAVKANAEKQLNKLATQIITEKKDYIEAQKIGETLKDAGFDDAEYIETPGKTITKTYSNTITEKQNILCPIAEQNCNSDLTEDKFPSKVLYSRDKTYLFLLKQVSPGSANYQIIKAYEIKREKDSDGNFVVERTLAGGEDVLDIKFISSNKGDYINRYLKSFGSNDILVKYFDTGTDKALPAIVPFSIKEGWYAQMNSVVSFGDSSSYDESARLSTMYICNVGKDGIEGTDDDVCQSVDAGVSGTYTSGLFGRTDTEATALVEDAIYAVKDASLKYGQTSFIIKRHSNGESIPVKTGSPIPSVPEMECTDYMSVKQCQILFNVCDPVVCPSSRCNFDGAYPNRNVVQSGIIGSLMLCLPNYKHGIYIPICLTGVKAGLDGYISILDSYKKCLQEKLDTGKTTGICDEVHSLYLCQFFWKQALPLAKLGIPKIIEVMVGEGANGGGEYLNVQSAFDSAKKSGQYLLNYYQADSNRLFKVNSFEELVSDSVCKAYASGTYPEVSLLDSLTEPNSPAQFYGRFDTETMTTATNPPVAHYKVYYHIFAGKNQGAYYQVYLMNEDKGGYYKDTTSNANVASGYIGIGETVDEAKDFTATAGYKSLCIQVNSQKECGFGQVSTSLAVDYMKDKYLAEQATATNINSEQECLSSTATIYDVIGVNPQSIAENALGQSIYATGLIRVCATENPGKGTDANYLDSKTARWQDIGKCSETMKCWLDMKSVNDTIENMKLKQGVLNDVNAEAQKNLEGVDGAMSENDFEQLMKNLRDDKTDFSTRINIVNNNLDRTGVDVYKGNLLFERAWAWGEIAKVDADIIKKKLQEQANRIAIKESVAGGDTGGSGNVASGESVINKDDCSNLIISCHSNICSYNDFKSSRTEDEVNNAINSASDKISVTCKKYVKKVVEIAKQENVDPLLIIALMDHESNGCDPQASSETRSYTLEEGASVGLMQISCKSWNNQFGLPENLEECANYLKANPEQSIEIGVQILKKKYNEFPNGKIFSGACCEENQKIKFTGWLAALRGYNGWGCYAGYKDQDIFVKYIMDNYIALINGLSPNQNIENPIISGGNINTEVDEKNTILKPTLTNEGILTIQDNCDKISYRIKKQNNWWFDSFLYEIKITTEEIKAEDVKILIAQKISRGDTYYADVYCYSFTSKTGDILVIQKESNKIIYEG